MKKTALITGASRGIGKSIAAYLAKEGYDLYLTCQNNIDMLQTLESELSRLYNTHCKIFSGNIGSYEFVKKMFNEIDSVDVVINNAGISYVGLLTEMSEKDWHEIVSVNMDSVFYISKEASKKMLLKHTGKIINISSVWGNIGASMEVAYSTTKGGINAFTKALAKELAPSGITVNAIACGFIDTDMNSHLSDDDKEYLRNEIPADRFGQPDDIAKTVLSIINASDYMTGQVITVDGGWT